MDLTLYNTTLFISESEIDELLETHDPEARRVIDVLDDIPNIKRKTVLSALIGIAADEIRADGPPALHKETPRKSVSVAMTRADQELIAETARELHCSFAEVVLAVLNVLE